MTFKHQPSKIATEWIVVADRSEARILEHEGDINGLRELITLSHPESEMKQSDCVSDHSGRLSGRGGTPIAAEPKTDWEHKNADLFASEVVDYLETGRNAQKFGRIVLFAAPAFLGAIRQKVQAPLARMIELEIDRDYTNCSIAEISAHYTDLGIARNA